MADPLVCCVMLVNGREAMVNRAILSFQNQTYSRRRLLIYDTTPHDTRNRITLRDDLDVHMCDEWPTDERSNPLTIGELRNAANDTEAARAADVLCHWDSDDWSHPIRIAERAAHCYALYLITVKGRVS